jgi:hypothetical protein
VTLGIRNHKLKQKGEKSSKLIEKFEFSNTGIVGQKLSSDLEKQKRKWGFGGWRSGE